MSEFDIEKIKNYIEESFDNQFKNGKKLVSVNTFTQSAILSVFDKNKDGDVSIKEFNQVTEEEYSVFAEKLAQYNRTKHDRGKIYTFSELKNLIKDGVLNADDFMYSDKFLKIANNQNLKEYKHFENSNTMTEQEFDAELNEYGIANINREQLKSVRQAKNLFDENSDIVDFHIGTFQQGNNKNCTLLSIIENLTDKELKRIYKVKIDENGNTYYEIKFPSDKQKVIVTQEELDNMMINYDGKDIIGFSSGDKDVTLFEMAYIKRFGTEMFENGASPDKVLKLFNKRGKAKEYNNVTEEMLMSDKNKVCGLKEINEIVDSKGIKYNSEDKTITLSSGEVYRFEKVNAPESYYGKYVLVTPDGTKIAFSHSYSVKDYDSDKKEVTISDPSENSTEIKIPFELMQVFILVK